MKDLEKLELSRESIQYRIFREALDFLTDSKQVTEKLVLDILGNIQEVE